MFDAEAIQRQEIETLRQRTTGGHYDLAWTERVRELKPYYGEVLMSRWDCIAAGEAIDPVEFYKKAMEAYRVQTTS